MSAPGLDEARHAMSRGDVLIAYDQATSALDRDPDNLDARFLAALALARAGAGERGRDATRELLRRINDRRDAPLDLREDAEALLARLAKDDAVATHTPDRANRLQDAASAYETVAAKYGGYFSCINAATLYCLVGSTDRARALAEQARERAIAARADEPHAYWPYATEAEAALILTDVAAARRALDAAARAAPADFAARAVTRRQLRLVCTANGLPADLLDALHCPSVLHYCGHRIDRALGGRLRVTDEPRVAREVREFLEHRDVGFAYGSLASGADIIVAEALLERGAEVHVVLPFGAEEFEQISVAPAGTEWVQRYQVCLTKASSVSCACDSAFLGDDELFAYAARIAMGHALNRARFLDTSAEQLAIWDRHPEEPTVGTAHDIAQWRHTGRPAHVIEVPPNAWRRIQTSAVALQAARKIRAIVFTDFRGFSRLHDEHFPTFVGQVLGAFGTVLDNHTDAISYQNSWGDAIQAVFVDVGSAAACALELHDALARFDLDRAGLPPDLGLRIGIHAGPVMTIEDPIRHRLGIWGRELTRAARIEPRTPEGEVYVTDAFAALLALEPDTGFASEYVGRVTTAKDFETVPMYRLRRVRS